MDSTNGEVKESNAQKNLTIQFYQGIKEGELGVEWQWSYYEKVYSRFIYDTFLVYS
jgi:hypothetical protein